MDNELNYFFKRLDDSSTIGIISDINTALHLKLGEKDLLSDRYEDMDVKIDYPNFHIDEFILPLNR